MFKLSRVGLGYIIIPLTSFSPTEVTSITISNDLGNNVSEIKLSANTNTRYCCKCHSELQDHEDILCDNCLEETYNERLSDA